MDLTNFYILFVSFISIYTVACRIGYLRLLRYYEESEELKSDADILKLQNTLREQMLFIFVTLPFGGGAVILMIIYGFNGILRINETILFVVLIALNTYATKRVKSLELKIAEIPAESTELASKRDHSVFVWQKKLLPRFDN